MVIGVPKEIKNSENRVALVPSGVEALTSREANRVLVEVRRREWERVFRTRTYHGRRRGDKRRGMKFGGART